MWDPLDIVVDPKDKGNYRAAMHHCLVVLAKRQAELGSIAAGMKPAHDGYRNVNLTLLRFFAFRVPAGVLSAKKSRKGLPFRFIGFGPGDSELVSYTGQDIV